MCVSGEGALSFQGTELVSGNYIQCYVKGLYQDDLGNLLNDVSLTPFLCAVHWQIFGGDQ